MPKLTDAGLNAALAGLDALGISRQAKTMLRDILTTAASSAPITPDTLLAGMRDERRESVAQVAKAVVRQRRGVVRRGRENLLALSEDEWQRLVDEANQA